MVNRMKKYPLVSVIVPIYKTEKYLSRCIESIRRQTYPELEIILIDDGSKDRCPQICDNYALLDPRIKVFHKKNGGVSSARNMGLKKMTGSYVAFVDSDDFISKDYIKTLLLLCKRNHCEISQCAMIYGRDSKFEQDTDRHSLKLYNKYEAFFHRKVKSGVAGKLYQASLFEGLQFPDHLKTNYEDEALSYQLVYRALNIAVYSKKMYYYYQRPGSATRNRNHFKSTQLIEVLEDRIEFFRKKEKNLMEVSEEYFMICLMLFYFECRKDKENSNDLDEILSIYKKYYKKVICQPVTSIHHKLILSAFLLAPQTCAELVNKLKLI